MSDKPIESSVDVLITSQRESFWQDVQVILKGYYPYKLHFAKDSDSILSPTESLNPLLALVDGHGGTLATSEWVQSVKMTYPDCPLIVLYGPGDQLDFNLVKKNGANFIMHMSYDREFVSDMILTLAPVEMRGANIPVSALLPIEMNDVNTEEDINFDVYVHLPSNGKSFRVRKGGGKIDDRLLEKSDLTHQRLYIKKTQIKPFFEYARTILTMRDVATPVPQTERIYKSKQLIHEIVSEILNSEMADFQAGKAIFERCRMILNELEITTEKTLDERIKEIYRFTGHPRSTYQDALSMAVFAAGFASLLGMDAAKTESAALAGLLHNVGLVQMPLSAIGKAPKDFTPEETAEYKLYPDRSVILIKAKKIPLPPEVSTGIVQHQENAGGSGFPHGLTNDKIEPMGKVLRLAMRFMELTALDGEKLGMTPKAAIAAIREESLSEKSCVDLVTISQVFKKFGS
jgi:HD-GYP domain-containing protein (c-di-GMP phosphodiesterase class II)